jgi:hypothetical protein
MELAVTTLYKRLIPLDGATYGQEHFGVSIEVLTPRVVGFYLQLTRATRHKTDEPENLVRAAELVDCAFALDLMPN